MNFVRPWQNRLAVLAFSVLALATVPVCAQPRPQPNFGFLNRLEEHLKVERDKARIDQQYNQNTLDASESLLERAQTARNPAAVAAAERAVNIAQQALGKNKLREERAMRALGWVQRLKQEGASRGPIGAFLPRVEGSVEVQPAGNGPARKLSGDVPPVAGPGDTVKTGADGRADFLLQDGSMLKLDAESAVTLLDQGAELLFGQINAKLKHWNKQMYVVSTPTAVCAVRGTDFIVREKAGRPTSVIVIEGTVAFSDKRGTKTVLVNAGQQSYLLPDGTPAEPSSANIQDMPKWWEE